MTTQEHAAVLIDLAYYVLVYGGGFVLGSILLGALSDLGI